jgi:hypothetical protein
VKEKPLGLRLFYLNQNIDHPASHDAERRYKARQDPGPEKDAKQDNVIDVPQEDLRRIVDVSRNVRHGFVLLLNNHCLTYVRMGADIAELRKFGYTDS